MEYLQKKTFNHITPEQVDHFMQHGFIRVKNCFTQEQADAWTKDVWDRLGFDPNDKSTWTRERTNMPTHQKISVKDFAPKAWDAICELVGGEDRIDEKTREWGDSFIVNVGAPEHEGKEFPPKELTNWHVDGDFFVHFLDSPEQGLLVIPCWSDVHASGGATWICSEGPAQIGKWLHDHPFGVSPWMEPIETLPPSLPEPPNSTRLSHFHNVIRHQPPSTFHEMTGAVGDVILLHPLTLHSASPNPLRHVRIITNPPIALKEPFNFSRPNPQDYSLVELKTIEALKPLDLREWKITGPRRPVVPQRLKVQEEMRKAENERLRGLGKEVNERGERIDDLPGHGRGRAEEVEA